MLTTHSHPVSIVVKDTNSHISIPSHTVMVSTGTPLPLPYPRPKYLSDISSFLAQDFNFDNNTTRYRNYTSAFKNTKRYWNLGGGGLNHSFENEQLNHKWQKVTGVFLRKSNIRVIK
jgi:hypothetical protein